MIEGKWNELLYAFDYSRERGVAVIRQSDRGSTKELCSRSAVRVNAVDCYAEESRVLIDPGNDQMKTATG